MAATINHQPIPALSVEIMPKIDPYHAPRITIALDLSSFSILAKEGNEESMKKGQMTRKSLLNYPISTHCHILGNNMSRKRHLAHCTNSHSQMVLLLSTKMNFFFISANLNFFGNQQRGNMKHHNSGWNWIMTKEVVNLFEAMKFK